MDKTFSFLQNTFSLPTEGWNSSKSARKGLAAELDALLRGFGSGSTLKPNLKKLKKLEDSTLKPNWEKLIEN